jgi:tetrahydromethanopterin S-methyltransferase subunit G
MAPTDREFDEFLRRLRQIEEKVDELREEVAVRRGIDSVLRWMAGGGGLVGLFGAIITFWKSGPP